jgi:hypothetical protein
MAGPRAGHLFQNRAMIGMSRLPARNSPPPKRPLPQCISIRTSATTAVRNWTTRPMLSSSSLAPTNLTRPSRPPTTCWHVHDGHECLGRLYQAKGDHRQAVECYHRVIAFARNEPHLYDPDFLGHVQALIDHLESAGSMGHPRCSQSA